MGKIDVISFEDEEGTHIIPLGNIITIAKEIGHYNYRLYKYDANFSPIRYTVRLVNGELFYITKQLYEKIEKSMYNIVLKDKRGEGQL